MRHDLTIEFSGQVERICSFWSLTKHDYMLFCITPNISGLFNHQMSYVQLPILLASQIQATRQNYDERHLNLITFHVAKKPQPPTTKIHSNLSKQNSILQPTNISLIFQAEHSEKDLIEIIHQIVKLRVSTHQTIIHSLSNT